MGVRDNHKMYEPKTQRWRPGKGIASAGRQFQNLQFRAKISLLLPKTALEPAENGQMRGHSGYSTHQLDFPVPKGPLGPSNSPRTAPQKPPKAPEFGHIGR